MPDTTMKSQLYVFPQEVTDLLLSSEVGTPIFLRIISNIFSKKFAYIKYPELESEDIDNLISNNVLTLWAWCMDENIHLPFAQFLRALSIHLPTELPGKITLAEKGILLGRAITLWYEIFPNLERYIAGAPELEVLNDHAIALCDVLEILITKQYSSRIIAEVVSQLEFLSDADKRRIKGKVNELISNLKRNFVSHKEEIERGVLPEREVRYLLGIQTT